NRILVVALFMARRAELDGARRRLCYVVAEASAGRAARSP
ncbi:hypothetical protein A2U01_0096725, partial [Trifolium medium]|nr:hypothetical protein [Trifolium medium]